MKNFLALLAFFVVMLIPMIGTAQSTTTTSSTNTNSWANYNLPAAVMNYVLNGGQIPQNLAGKVISAASSWGMQYYGLTLGQMWSLYNAGKITITLVATSPPSLTFSVHYLSGNIAIVLQDF